MKTMDLARKIILATMIIAILTWILSSLQLNQVMAATGTDVKLNADVTGISPQPTATAVHPAQPSAGPYGIPISYATPKAGQETQISGTESTLMAVPIGVPADGENAATVIVTLRNSERQPLAGYEVELTSSRSEDAITAVRKVTGADGVALFTITSQKVGSAIISGRVSNSTIEQKAVVQFTSPALTKVKLELPLVLTILLFCWVLLKAICIWLKYRKQKRPNYPL